MVCRLGSIRTNLKLDIGFGDAVFPGPVQLDYPVLLDSPPFTIYTYSLESVIAEKFEAMISLDRRNSRMKDFYDIHYILQNYKLDPASLEEAVRQTLKRRKSILPNAPAVFDDTFRRDLRNLQLWKAFLNRIQAPPLAFEVVLDTIGDYLRPIYKKMHRGNTA